MIALGYALHLSQSHRKGTTPPGPSGPVYLPALATSGARYHNVYSNARLLQDHAGPLLSAGADFGTEQAGIAASEVQAARGANEALRVAGWYDQSGNGRHAIAAISDEQPALREDVTIGGTLAMVFDGQRLGDARGAQRRRVSAPATLTASDCTIAYVIDPTVSVQEQYYFELLNAQGDGTSLGHLQYPGAQFGGALPDLHGNIALNAATGLGLDGGRKIATVPQVMILRSTAAGVDVFIDGEKIATTIPLSGTTGMLFIGMSADAALTAFNANFRLGCFVTIDKGVTDPDVAAITSALMQRFAIPSGYDAVVVNIGTSRVAVGSLGTVSRTKEWFERSRYGMRRVKTYNLGMDGRALSYHHANRAAWSLGVYDAAKPVVYVLDDAINDLGGLGASTDPAAIYAMLSTFRDALQAQGANVHTVLATCIPQASGAYVGLTGRMDAAIDADREALNAAIRANTARASAISDAAASTAMGAYPASPNDLANYPDKLHPSSAGYEFLAPFNPAVTTSLLS